MGMVNPIDRAKGAFYGLAVGDALGAPVEFLRRGTFEPVTTMRSGGYFRLPPGAWTDDTAMALCLAQSLAKYPDLDEADLIARFRGWVDRAENTSTGKCIGIGQNTLRVLMHLFRTGETQAPSGYQRADGNGAVATYDQVHHERQLVFFGLCDVMQELL
ncbi:MAG: ADP-ribosylglycohydrolase family protein [Pedobacter sp.]|nr:MAG: ADP-ribosylglycohydrolase family protein [Pedobacter sp.]